MKIIFTSIRWRLLIWHGLILTAVVTGFGFTAYRLEYAHRLRRIDDGLQERSSLLTGAVRPPPPPSGFPPRSGAEPRLPSKVASLFEGGSATDLYYIVWLSDGRLQARSANAPDNVAMPERKRPDQWQFARTRGEMREFVRFTSLDRCILTGRSISGDMAELRRRAWWLVGAGGVVLALGLAGGWWLATRAIRPIDEISATAARIAAGDLSQRIHAAETDDELGRLADVLNSTFARLEAAFAQQARFTADASHELRTPLAVMIAEAQTTLARKRSAAEYRQTVEACLETAQQMRRLSESLLELARLDAGQEHVRRSRLDLAENVRACVERIRPLAAARGIQVNCKLAPAQTLGDSDRLTQVITNLLTNAIDYNKPNGEIRVSTRAENGAATLTVADSGEGVAPEDCPRIFERFYRADVSRARASGRSGLGLAICKAIVDAHGGSLEMSSQRGVGTTFTVRLAG